MTLLGKTIVVTGAGTGIGEATAVAAAAEGASVALLGRRPEVLESTADRIRSVESAGEPKVTVHPTDLSHPDEADRAAAAILEEFGGVDGLVNNAGIGVFDSLGDAELGDLQMMFDLHVTSPVVLMKRFLPSLRERRASIVNVTSVAGALSAPHRSFYGATKAAITHMSRSLAVELAPEVRVNAILPGPVDTPIYDALEYSPERMAGFREKLVAMTPAGRFGVAEEVAPWVCRFLDSDSAWVTGTVLPIDGGRCA